MATKSVQETASGTPGSVMSASISEKFLVELPSFGSGCVTDRLEEGDTGMGEIAIQGGVGDGLCFHLRAAA
jgi:hypothetical protein